MLFCFSVNHHHAPLHIRECLAVTPSQRQKWRSSQQGEAVILSTCNRIELYLEVPTVEDAVHEWHKLMGDHTLIAESYTEMTSGQEAARHLFRVAAGLESMVLGEPEILGQVISSYDTALESETAGPKLSMLFRAAIHAAKEARTHTHLSRGSVSFISMAINRIEALTGRDVADLSVVVFGAGEMGATVLSGLSSRSAESVVVISRTIERAQAAAAERGGIPKPLAYLTDELAQADVLFTATAAPHTVIEPPMLENRSRPLTIIDLAVPRDVDPIVGTLEPITLLNLEDLQDDVRLNLADRETAAEEATAMLEAALAAFVADYHTRAVVPTITKMRAQAEALRQAELERILNRLPANHDEYAPYLEEFSRRLMNKMLHHPTVSLRQHAADPDFEHITRDLFGLDDE